MPDQPEYNYDLFISYAEADRAWVKGYLLDALDNAKVNYHLEEAFAVGMPRLLEFERAIQQSRRTLLVISRAYLAEGFSRFVDLLAQSYDLEKETWHIIPVVLDPDVKLPTRLAMLTALDARNSAGWPHVVERLCTELQCPVPAISTRPPCPYPGMVPYSGKDARFFYGRKTEIDQMLQHLRHQRYLFVIGPSGCGKSSLVFAGLLPQLAKSSYFPQGFWLVREMRPGSQPMQKLAEALGSGPAQSARVIADLLAANSTAKCLLLVVDQFEEFFTQTERAEQSRFIAALKALQEVKSCALLIAMRADFYPDLMSSDLWPVDPSQRLEIAPLRGEALRQAIQQPAADVGVYLEAGLLERLLADAAEEPGVLPMLQETMVLLWGDMHRRLLTLSAYERLGREGHSGLAVAMATKADATLAELPVEEKAIARRIFLRLIQFGEGRADTRRQQSVTELRSASRDPRLFDKILDHLADNRLLTRSGVAKEGAEMRVDIAHEALISGWPTLYKWLDERREAELTRRRLVEGKAREWVRLGRGEGGLLDAVELAEAERWLNSPDAADLGPGPYLPALVQASRAAIQKAEQEREAARQLELAQAQALAEERARATAQALAAQAPQQYEEYNRHERAALLARQAFLFNQRYDGDYLSHVDAALRSVLSKQYSSVRLGGEPDQPAILGLCYSSDGSQLATGDYGGALRFLSTDTPPNWSIVDAQGERAITALALGASDRLFATGHWNGRVYLWNRSRLDQVPKVLTGHKHKITSLAFAPNGRFLATASYDATVRVWDLENTDRPPLVLGDNDPEESASSVAFSPDGLTLASSWMTRSIILWDLTTTELRLLSLEGTRIWAKSISFSPDGSILAAAGDYGLLQLWDLNQQPPRCKTLPCEMAETEAFSPDGRYLAVAGRHIQLYDLDHPDAEPETLSGHTSEIGEVAFDPRGGRLASASNDGTVRIWNLDRPPAIPFVRVRDHSVGTSIYSVASKDTLIAVSWDMGVVQFFDTRRPDEILFMLRPREALDPRLLGWAMPIYDVAFCPKNGLFATAHSAAICVWNLEETPPRPVPLEGQKGWVGSVAFSPDGNTITSCGGDGNVRLWDITQSIPVPRVLRVQSEELEHGLHGVAFSPSGHLLVVGGGDGKIWRCELSDPTSKLDVIGEHSEVVRDLAFSPDGRYLASGGDDWRALVIDLKEQTSVELFHEGRVNSVSFSPDGSTLASASSNGTVYLWDFRHPQRSPILLRGHKASVQSLAFADKGNWLVTGGWDGTVRLWIPKTKMLAEMVCRRVWRNLSKEEWNVFVGRDVEYERTCPGLPPG